MVLTFACVDYNKADVLHTKGGSPSHIEYQDKQQKMKESYGTLSETINELKREGYTIDFNTGFECLVCNEIPSSLSPDDFIIDKVYRFEGASNPDDQSILYAISSSRYNAKGLLVNGYGISAVTETNAVIEKLRTHNV